LRDMLKEWVWIYELDLTAAQLGLGVVSCEQGNGPLGSIIDISLPAELLLACQGRLCITE
jgi:hypothetical protein